MRKSIDQALKWYQQSKILKGIQSKEQQSRSYMRKIIEIKVVQGFNLSISGLGS